MSPDEQPVQPEAAETGQELEPDIRKHPILAVNDAAAGANIEDISTEPPNEAEVLAEEEEAPPPSTVHPSAAAGSSPEDEAIIAGREEHGEFFIGMWYDKPNFGCPYCSFSTVEQGGNGLTELHVLAMIESGDLKHMAALQLKGE